MTRMKSVVIVGAGVVGLFCAVRLAQAGAKVTLLEAEDEDLTVFGPGASAAAAGMLAPLGDAASPHDALAHASYDLWKRSHASAGWGDGVRFGGGVVAARDEVDASALLARAATLGRPAEALTAWHFRKRTGLKTKLDDTVLLEDEGVADPLRVLTGLRMQAHAHGVILRYNQEVESVTPTAVTTYEGATYEADAVVLAVGYWGCERLAAVSPALKHVAPAKGQLVPVSLAQPLLPNFRAPGFYLTHRREDVVLGATFEPGKADRRADQAGADELLAACATLLPGEVKATGRGWAGVRPMSPDGWPLIGPSGGAFIATGHSRNGWLLAPITAEIITAYVFGAEILPEWAALSPQRFETP
jgi:glycine oxidase